MEKLNVILATYNNRAENLKNVLQKPKEYVTYIISHQVTEPLNNSTLQTIKEIFKRKDVIYSRIASNGLSKNRNNAIKYVKEGLVLCADDDVKFYDNAFEKIIHSFVQYPQADLITYKIKTPDGKDFKNYPKKSFKHNLKSIFRVGSVEIAFRIDKIRQKNLIYDEQFGIGSNEYQVGEEYIFLADALKSGLNCYFFPIPILIHPPLSTGDRVDDEIIFSRGAVMARTYGKIAYIIDFLFSLKKYHLYRKNVNFLRYLKLMIDGSKSYLKKYGIK